jgi:hypothetical protein
MEQLKSDAIRLLKEEFDPALDYNLTLEKTYDTHPLHESGTSALFSFRPFQEKQEQFYVITGNALPMIYPDYGLTHDELWAVHIGMEYFIKMNVAEDTTRNPAKLLGYLKMVATAFQDQLYITLTDPPKIEKVYKLEDQKHVVGKVRFDEILYSWIVGDIPHFVYKKDLPPQIIWSLHMGRILLT